MTSKVMSFPLRICIALKTDMVTASYCTDPMQALHQEAIDAGITVVNEVGRIAILYYILLISCYLMGRMLRCKVYIVYCHE